uniref:Homeodomain-like domain-containing protein n=2 Tax=Candidatus Kentrum eta TaxID=2126337 RepID=A0A450V1S6_9GAMM|nr:MAG: Homeodomain-like domain-containing protein [Candidatus Kentron sp. H]VFK03662.1 MAG: Homeodomain-like domain-containing protein [Candidatus Kentron sp. H]
MGEGEQGNSLPDREVAEGIGCTRRTVEQIRERCICEGLQAALERRVRFRERSRVLDGEDEARLVSLACNEPPEGQSRWTLRMLGERLVELEIVESISPETIRQTLKKRYVPEPSHPVVCMDEASVQRVKEVRAPIPAQPGHSERYDVEYERNGVAHLLAFHAPISEIAAWTITRNQSKKPVDWHFTTDNARINLKCLYPNYQID